MSDYVCQLVPGFSIESIVWVRTLKSPRSIYNVQVTNVKTAASVRDAFATAVKAASPPSFVKNVSMPSSAAIYVDIDVINVVIPI